MVLSVFFDAVILFLLIYAVIDLGHQLVRLLSKWLTDGKDANPGLYLLRLADLPPDRAEYQIRLAARLSCPLWLITDDADGDTLTIANRLAHEFSCIQAVSQNSLIEQLSQSTAPAVFSADNEEAAPAPNK